MIEQLKSILLPTWEAMNTAPVSDVLLGIISLLLFSTSWFTLFKPYNYDETAVKGRKENIVFKKGDDEK